MEPITAPAGTIVPAKWDFLHPTVTALSLYDTKPAGEFPRRLRVRARSLPSLEAEHDADCLVEDFDVEAERKVLHVVEVVLDLGLRITDRAGVAIADLRPPRQSWL